MEEDKTIDEAAAEKLDEPVVSGKGDIEIKSTLENKNAVKATSS